MSVAQMKFEKLGFKTHKEEWAIRYTHYVKGFAIEFKEFYPDEYEIILCEKMNSFTLTAEIHDAILEQLKELKNGE